MKDELNNKKQSNDSDSFTVDTRAVLFNPTEIISRQISSLGPKTKEMSIDDRSISDSSENSLTPSQILKAEEEEMKKHTEEFKKQYKSYTDNHKKEDKSFTKRRQEEIENQNTNKERKL